MSLDSNPDDVESNVKVENSILYKVNKKRKLLKETLDLL